MIMYYDSKHVVITPDNFLLKHTRDIQFFKGTSQVVMSLALTNCTMHISLSKSPDILFLPNIYRSPSFQRGMLFIETYQLRGYLFIIVPTI